MTDINVARFSMPYELADKLGDVCADITMEIKKQIPDVTSEMAVQLTAQILNRFAYQMHITIQEEPEESIH